MSFLVFVVVVGVTLVNALVFAVFVGSPWLDEDDEDDGDDDGDVDACLVGMFVV